MQIVTTLLDAVAVGLLVLAIGLWLVPSAYIVPVGLADIAVSLVLASWRLTRGISAPKP